MQKITPCLWFDFQAEEAVAHYLRVFRNGRVLATSHYGETMGEHRGKVLTIRFEIEGQEFLALNGGPQFPFTEAVSLSVDCADQAEVDRLWDALAEGGSHGPCGWLKDRFGLSWQIVPSVVEAMTRSSQPERIDRMMGALMQMGKLDIAQLQAAFDGG
ncbi:VOC family protein [Xenophilus azovorans]|uniref:VOC family protein n=1 Tax=Xenophilus azovorans TaxID=151755 RepID=UPI00056FACCB|nr:VOC family protein [Xenophilus azovorans]